MSWWDFCASSENILTSLGSGSPTSESSSLSFHLFFRFNWLRLFFPVSSSISQDLSNMLFYLLIVFSSSSNSSNVTSWKFMSWPPHNIGIFCEMINTIKNSILTLRRVCGTEDDVDFIAAFKEADSIDLLRSICFAFSNLSFSRS